MNPKQKAEDMECYTKHDIQILFNGQYFCPRCNIIYSPDLYDIIPFSLIRPITRRSTIPKLPPIPHHTLDDSYLPIIRPHHK